MTKADWFVGIAVLATTALLLTFIWRQTLSERTERERLSRQARACANSGGIPMQDVLLRIVCIRSGAVTTEVMP